MTLKEPPTLGRLFASQDLPIPRHMLAPALTRGTPLQHGRQRGIFHHDPVRALVSLLLKERWSWNQG
jgi:hypothetical protein